MTGWDEAVSAYLLPGTVLGQIEAAVVVTDPQGNLRYANAYAAKLFANPKHALLDRFAMPISADGHVHAFLVARAGNALRICGARLVLF